jgi:TP901 family phage tail tape measure protein
MTTTDVAAQGITAALNAYGLQATDAGKISDIMFQTVNDGVITFDQLANNMGNVLPVANSLGIGMDQVGAAYAQMTLNGVNASAAETQISALMRSALNPTTQLTAAVQAHGYASAESLIQTEGLSGYLDVLNDAAGGSQSAMLDLTGSQEAMNAATILGQDGVADYNEELDKMTHASDGAGATQTALAKQMESSAFKIAKAKQSLEILAVTLGGVLLPVIGKAAEGLTGLLTNSIMPFVNGSLLPGIAKFGKMFSGQFDFYKQLGKSDISAAFSALGITLEHLTGLNLDTWFKRVGDAMQRPIDAARKMFDALKVGNWKKLVAGIGDALSSPAKLVGDMLKGISTGFKPLDKLLQNTGKLFTDFGRIIQEVFQGDFAGALAVGERMLGHFGDQAQAVWDLIKTGIDSINWGAVGDQLGNFASGAWAAIQTGISLAWDQITDLNWDNYITAIGDFAGLVAGKIKDLPWGDFLTAVGDLGILIATKIKDLPWGDYLTAVGDLGILIATKIKDLPWGDYLTAVGDLGILIATKIKDLPWVDFLTAVGDLTILIAEKIKDLPWVDFITGVGDLAILIATKIKDLPWGDYITGAGDLAILIAGKIKDLPWGDYITGAVDILAAVGNKIINLPWGDFITGTIDILTAVGDKILSLPWGDYVTGAVDILTAVGDKIISLPWGDYITGAVDIITAVGDKIIALPWGDFITAIADLGALIGAKIPSFTWPTITKEDILNAIVPGNPAGGGSSDPSFQGGDGGGGSSGGDNGGDGSGGFGIRAPQGVTIKYTADTTDLENNSMLKGLFGGGTGAPPIQPIKIPAPDISMVSSVMIAVPQIVGQNMSAALSAASTYASAIGTVVGTAIGTMVGNVGALMGAFTAAVGTGMSGALSAASVYASAIYVSVSTNIGLMVGNTAALMGAFTVAVGEGMSAALGAAAVYSGAIVSAVAGAFGQVPGIAASAFGAVPGIIAGALSGAAGTAYAMGANIGASLAAGISSQIGAVAAAAAALAAAAEAATRQSEDRLTIESLYRTRRAYRRRLRARH